MVILVTISERKISLALTFGVETNPEVGKGTSRGGYHMVTLIFRTWRFPKSWCSPQLPMLFSELSMKYTIQLLGRIGNSRCSFPRVPRAQGLRLGAGHGELNLFMAI